MENMNIVVPTLKELNAKQREIQDAENKLKDNKDKLRRALKAYTQAHALAQVGDKVFVEVQTDRYRNIKELLPAFVHKVQPIMRNKRVHFVYSLFKCKKNGQPSIRKFFDSYGEHEISIPVSIEQLKSLNATAINPQGETDVFKEAHSKRNAIVKLNIHLTLYAWQQSDVGKNALVVLESTGKQRRVTGVNATLNDDDTVTISYELSDNYGVKESSVNRKDFSIKKRV